MPIAAMRPTAMAWSCAVVPLLFGLLGVLLGQDANWDLRNYHWYNPYALLTGRWDFDIGPSGFFNPLLDLPTWLGAQHLSAKTLSFLLATVHGLNYVPLYFLAHRLLLPVEERRRSLAAMALALVGVTGGGHIGLVGTTFNDNIVSILVLGSALVVVRNAERLVTAPLRAALGTAALAGLLMGAGVGLKLPSGVLAVGFCLAFLCVAAPAWRRLQLAVGFGVGVLAGVAILSGYWMWMMWRDYANPLFPYFNGIFKSSMVLAANYRDVRFVPHGILEWLFYPVIITFDPLRTGEIYFRDARMMTAFLLWLATPAFLILRRRAEPALVTPFTSRYLLAGCGLTLIVWMSLFGIYRYVIALEMLAPLLIVGAIACWPITPRLRATGIALALAFVTVTARPGSWSRLPEWTDQFVEVTAPSIADNSLVVVTGFEPTSFVIPAFPPKVLFVRLQGYLNDPKDGDTGLNRTLRQIVDRHRGDIYVLFSKKEPEKVGEVLPQYGLRPDMAKCTVIETNLTRDIRFCPVGRARSG